jgi:hypothetical protein
MSCTQRQRGGGAERGEAHVRGRGVVGIACGSGGNMLVVVVQRPWTSCHVVRYMHCILMIIARSRREN